ncbi:MAG: peptidylprolyl isomerase [Desulfuromonadaceae bacterium]|nr:peptidylprolyl isomerase [Desulfuromonadaceae bacterium]MDD5107524.1 peptidylprolyl isomerase [Desulfuromonadaceae bacterium]
MHTFTSTQCLKGLLVAALVICAHLAGATDPDVKKDGVPAAPPTVAAPPNAVVRVNGVDIDAVELRRARKVMLRGQTVPAEQQSVVDNQVVEQLISAELLYQAAVKQAPKDLEKQTDEMLAQGKARFKDEADFKKTINDLEMDEKSLREYTKRQLVISSFVETEFVAKTTVPETEIRAFYDGNPDKFHQNETVKASHILIGVDSSASAEEKKKAHDKAVALRKELSGGADFATLAKENSTCPSSQQGGDLGFFGTGQMVPAFEKAAFALKPGEISDVVETQFGYHIIKLIEKKPAASVDYTLVKAKIEAFLKGQKVNEALQKFVADARKTAKIEMLLK